MDIDIKLPSSWADLSQDQLKTVFKYLASGSWSTLQCKLLLAFRFAGIKFYGFRSGEGALVRCNGVFIILTDRDMLALAHSLDFIDSYPDFPVRIFELKHRKAVHPLLRDLSFAQWLAVENFYFGYLMQKDISMLNEILTILYPRHGLFSKFIKSFNSSCLDYYHINVINWLASFKKWLSFRYPELFKETGVSPQDSPSISQSKVMESMNAQIRALTKGDITKKEAVLNMDVHSALEELEALAVEARRIKEAAKRK